MNGVALALANEDPDEAKKLFSEIFKGVLSGKDADPGMSGSLLYHMAMVTKMELETKILLQELKVEGPTIDVPLKKFFGEFASDAEELTRPVAALKVKPWEVASRKSLSPDEKVSLFTRLNKKTTALENLHANLSLEVAPLLEDLFVDWSQQILEMRLRQEYETIKGLLVTAELVKTLGLQRLQVAMMRIQEKFGEETLSIALKVTLKVGMKRERLQSMMLSDHYINYTMDIAKLDGRMQFLNCPIFGSHKHMCEELGMGESVAALFCRHFCFAHAKSMLQAVLPFTFELSHPQRMATHGMCEFYLRLGYSPTLSNSERFVPLVVSWNLTRKCDLKCSHCYINATAQNYDNELNTAESKRLIDQLSEVSRPMLILSGGEPLLRNDVFELIRYGTEKGLKMALGSNGGLIDNEVACQLKEAGISTVSISLDSSLPEQHDEFRGSTGSWQKAINAIKALRENGVLVQVNTTLTRQNYNDIDNIMSLIEQLSVENFHLFFLVPTGRGAKMADISPSMYEDMIKTTLARTSNHNLNVRPSCAPQFMRIAKDAGFDMRRWIRGCLAGLYYCRIYPTGEVTPCPYLPIKLGNIREKTFKEIWFGSALFKDLRDFDTLKGKCGECNYRNLCGGCRARAYGLSSDFIDFCGDLREPTSLKGDYLAEDPWCVYQPKTPEAKEQRPQEERR